MSWVAVGIGLGTTALGAWQANEQQKSAKKAQQSQMEAQAANLQYSPWTGFQGGAIGAQDTGSMADVVGSGLQSGMKGYMFGKQLQGKKPTASGGTWTGLESRYVQPKQTLYGVEEDPFKQA